MDSSLCIKSSHIPVSKAPSTKHEIVEQTTRRPAREDVVETLCSKIKGIFLLQQAARKQAWKHVGEMWTNGLARLGQFQEIHGQMRRTGLS